MFSSFEYKFSSGDLALILPAAKVGPFGSIVFVFAWPLVAFDSCWASDINKSTFSSCVSCWFGSGEISCHCGGCLRGPLFLRHSGCLFFFACSGSVPPILLAMYSSFHSDSHVRVVEMLASTAWANGHCACMPVQKSSLIGQLETGGLLQIITQSQRSVNTSTCGLQWTRPETITQSKLTCEHVYIQSTVDSPGRRLPQTARFIVIAMAPCQCICVYSVCVFYQGCRALPFSALTACQTLRLSCDTYQLI